MLSGRWLQVQLQREVTPPPSEQQPSDHSTTALGAAERTPDAAHGGTELKDWADFGWVSWLSHPRMGFRGSGHSVTCPAWKLESRAVADSYSAAQRSSACPTKTKTTAMKETKGKTTILCLSLSCLPQTAKAAERSLGNVRTWYAQTHFSPSLFGQSPDFA